MNIHDDDVIQRLHELAEGFDMPPAPLADDVRRGRQRVRRTRTIVMGTAAAAVAAILGATAALGGQDREGADGTDLIDRPGIEVDGVPVWYDAAGLHRGDVVEQVPVEILKPEEAVGQGGFIPARGALALVRTGVLYMDQATGDVYFHPWGGEPRIVGHDSAAGPGGDPNGDTAAGSRDPIPSTSPWRARRLRHGRRPGDLANLGECKAWATPVVNIAPPGNGFLEVSAERVVWIAERKTYSHDVRTQTHLSGPARGCARHQGRGLQRVGHLGHEGSWPGRAALSRPGDGLGRLSPSGNYVLAVRENPRHGAVIVDTRTGEVWPVPRNVYPWIAWSYDDIALVDTDDGFLACDAAARTCEQLETNRTVRSSCRRTDTHPVLGG